MRKGSCKSGKASCRKIVAKRQLQKDFCCEKVVGEKICRSHFWEIYLSVKCRRLKWNFQLPTKGSPYANKFLKRIVKYSCKWWRIPTQGSNGVPIYLYRGNVDVDNNKIKDDMKATGSEETICKLNMEATGTNNELYLQECYLLKNVIFVKIRCWLSKQSVLFI